MCIYMCSYMLYLSNNSFYDNHIPLYFSYIFLYNRPLQFTPSLTAITLCMRLLLSIVYGIPWYYVTHLSAIGATTGTVHIVGMVGVKWEVKERGGGHRMAFELWHFACELTFKAVQIVRASNWRCHFAATQHKQPKKGHHDPLPSLTPRTPIPTPLRRLCIAYFTAHRLIFNSRELPQF